MRVGLIMGCRQFPEDDRSFEDIYSGFIDTAVYAEELGWDRIWVPEHHLSDLWAPAPLTLLAGVATRTSRIRMGTYVAMVALHDPVRLAEQIATVDLLSNGRLDFAVGAHVFQNETDFWGIDNKETFGRTYESLRIMERCFSENEFSHHGKFYNYDNVHFSPKPVQKPVPFWSAANGPQSASLAAKRGYYLASGAGRGHDLYINAWKEAGRDPADMRISSHPLYGHIAESKEKAWDEYEYSFHHQLKFYELHQNRPAPPIGELRNVPEVGFGGQPVMVGTPDDILRSLEKYKGTGITGITDIAMGVSTYIADTKVKRRSMETFAKEVIPEVKKW